MTTFESNYSPAIEVNGVSFRLEVQSVIPVPILPFTGVSFRLGVQATNNTSDRLHFERLDSLEFSPTSPVLLDFNNQLKGMDGSDILRLWVGREPSYYIIPPAESAFFPLESVLYRFLCRLHLKIHTNSGGFIYFYHLKRGKYQIKLTHKNHEQILSCISPEELTSVRTWSGTVDFPFCGISNRSIVISQNLNSY